MRSKNTIIHFVIGFGKVHFSRGHVTANFLLVMQHHSLHINLLLLSYLVLCGICIQYANEMKSLPKFKKFFLIKYRLKFAAILRATVTRRKLSVEECVHFVFIDSFPADRQFKQKYDTQRSKADILPCFINLL